MYKLLLNLCNTKKFACLYSNFDNTSSFAFGRVIAVNECFVAINTVTPYGEDDGVYVTQTENIYRIETAGEYQKKMEKLCSIKLQNDEKIIFDNENIIFSVISTALKQKRILSIELIGSGQFDVVGFVESIDDKECKVKQIDEYGYFDGISFVNIENISKISYGSQDEKIVELLCDINNWKTGDGSLS